MSECMCFLQIVLNFSTEDMLTDMPQDTQGEHC